MSNRLLKDSWALSAEALNAINDLVQHGIDEDLATEIVVRNMPEDRAFDIPIEYVLKDKNERRH